MPFNPTELAITKRTTWNPQGAQQTSSLLQIVQALRRQYPRGVDAIVVGRASKAGWMELSSSRGAAILIGLLPPAVQKLSAPHDGDRQLLHSALSPTGRIGVIVADPIDSGSLVLPRVTWEV